MHVWKVVECGIGGLISSVPFAESVLVFSVFPGILALVRNGCMVSRNRRTRLESPLTVTVRIVSKSFLCTLSIFPFSWFVCISILSFRHLCFILHFHSDEIGNTSGLLYHVNTIV